MTSRIFVCLLLLIAGTSSIYSQNGPCDAFFHGANHRFAGRWDQAIAELTKAIDLKCPEIGRAYHLRGEARWGKKDYAGAWADATAAIPLLDEPALGHRLRGQLASAQADHKTALTEFTKAIELDPDYADGYLLRGETLEDLENVDAAIADYTRAIVLYDDRLADGYIYRAMAYNKKGDRVRAFADFNKAVAMAPAEPVPYYSRGYAHYSNKDYSAAIADLKKVLTIDPKYIEAHHYLGHSYHEQQQYREAIASYSAAIKLNPEFAGFYVDRAIVYRDQLELALSESDLVKAKELDASFVDFHLSLAWANLLNSNYANAAANASEILAKHGMKDNTPYAAAVGYLALKMANKTADATAFLKKWASVSAAGSWHSSLFKFLGGTMTAAQFLAASADDDRLAEARSFVGAMAILDGNPAIAKTQMDRIKAAGVKRSFPFSFFAVLSEKGVPPAPVSAYYTQGIEQYNAGRNTEAIASFTKAIAADPKRPEYYAARAKVNLTLRKIPAAKLDLEKAIAAGGTYEAYSLRANLHIENGSYDNAAADLEMGSKFLKPAEGDNTLPNHEATLAGVYALLGKSSAYKPTQDEETVSYYFYNSLYDDALNDKSSANYGLALAKFTAAANRFPGKTEFLAERGQVWGELGKPENALADYDKVLAVDRKRTYIHAFRGEALLAMKRYKEAIAAVDRALASPDADMVHARAYVTRAAANCALGNKAEAGIDEAEAKILGGDIEAPCR